MAFKPATPAQDRTRAAAARVIQFRASLTLFERNYDELLTFVDYFCSPRVAFSYSHVDQHWLWYEGISEIARLLHNFVAAAKSLIDHSRVLYQELYAPQGRIPDYQGQITERFTSDPLTQFVIKLREMSQHYRMPRLSSHTAVPGINDGMAKTVAIELRLATADLREFSGWNAASRRFLDTSGEHINIRTVAVNYNAAVLAFYGWFADRQREIHGQLPELVHHIARHGISGVSRPELAELEKGIFALEAMPVSRRTVADAQRAFAPVLSILDDRRLMLCAHDGRAWLEVALSAAASRFSLPDELVARIRALV